jgi:uncharacterized repeat protein (TIGR01451 family)
MSSRNNGVRWWFSRRSKAQRRAEPIILRVEHLEERTVPTVTVNSSFTGLDYNHSNGGYVPPDTQAAASPNGVVETVNQTVAIYSRSGSQTTSDSFNHFWTTTGGLGRTTGSSFLSDPVVTYDDHVGRFIIGDQDVDSNALVSNFDVAISKTNNPTTLSTSDWNFYQINTTESGYDADYPGNLGFNGGAFVFALNMFGSFSDRVQVTSVNLSDLTSGVSQSSLHVYHNDYNGFSLRPATMHDSASATDPMWLIEETGDGSHIDVVKMTNVLSNNATLTTTTLAVTPYQGLNYPLQPNGTEITNNIDSRIQKVAENGNLLVAAHAVGVSSTQDDIQWYKIDISSGSPVLSDQGDVSAGNNTYLTYPAIDINTSGTIGMTYMFSGTGAGQYMSTYVTGRVSTDPVGTMETPQLVQGGAQNYADFTGSGRAGDLAAINVDSDGTFWAANEYATAASSNNWGTAIAHFTVGSVSTTSADLAVTLTGPGSVTAGNTYTYTITLTNLGPNDAMSVSLSDALPTGLTLSSETQSGGPDVFSNTSTGNTASFTLADMPSGNTDTFTVTAVVSSTQGNGTTLTNTATVSSGTSDPNLANNSASVSSTVTNNNLMADMRISTQGPATVTRGHTYTYTVTVKNGGPNAAANVTWNDVLPSGMTLVNTYEKNGNDVFTNTTANGVPSFTLASMPNGHADTFWVIASIPTSDGSGIKLTQTYTVSSTTTDPNTSNNTYLKTSKTV